MSVQPTLRLGLIGDNIAASQSPRLHRLAGAQHKIAVTYERLVPIETNETFETVFKRCQTSGYRGINVTYPYKERVIKSLRIDDPLVRAMGAANTVVFDAEGPVGFNTDYTGFKAAYRHVRGDTDTGPVLMIGTGGVGRAVAFGLIALGTKDLRLVDRAPSKAKALAEALQRAKPDISVSIWDDPSRAALGAAGLVNCTPVGMVGHNGTPLPRSAMTGAEWAFDAVYTPVVTQFISDAKGQGLAVISGWELFFYQGAHAWAHFSNTSLNTTSLRHALLDGADAL